MGPSLSLTESCAKIVSDGATKGMEQELTSVVLCGQRSLPVQGRLLANGADSPTPILIDYFILAPYFLLLNFVLLADLDLGSRARATRGGRYGVMATHTGRG